MIMIALVSAMGKGSVPQLLALRAACTAADRMAVACAPTLLKIVVLTQSPLNTHFSELHS
jgi:hypothetical protein